MRTLLLTTGVRTFFNSFSILLTTFQLPLKRCCDPIIGCHLVRLLGGRCLRTAGIPHNRAHSTAYAMGNGLVSHFNQHFGVIWTYELSTCHPFKFFNTTFPIVFVIRLKVKNTVGFFVAPQGSCPTPTARWQRVCRSRWHKQKQQQKQDQWSVHQKRSTDYLQISLDTKNPLTTRKGIALEKTVRRKDVTGVPLNYLVWVIA